MTDLQGAPRNRSSLTPWLIGGGLLIVVGILGAFGAGWYWLQSIMVTDPAKVATLAAQIIPGAKAPDGLVGMWGFDSRGFRVAVFGPEPPDGETLEEGEPFDHRGRGMVIVLATGPRDDGTAKTMMQGEFDDDAELESLGIEKRVVGGVELEFERSRSNQDGVEMLHYAAKLPIPGGRIAELKILGPKDRFDHDAMTAFLAGIETLAPGQPKAPAKDKK